MSESGMDGGRVRCRGDSGEGRRMKTVWDDMARAWASAVADSLREVVNESADNGNDEKEG
jgi:hypothetical protein